MSDERIIEGIDVARGHRAGSTEQRRRRPSRRSRFELIAGGRSNLTFRVTDAAGGDWVLRRPPLGHVLATAHDMGREHRIISALGPTDVPVAPALGLCDRRGGQRRAVLRHGLRRRPRRSATRPRRQALDAEAAPPPASSLVDVLAAIHAVDPDAVGLGDLGRQEGYIARQLKRWYGQCGARRDDRRCPRVDEVHDAPARRRIPEQGPAAIVHGDYRLDNCMVDDDGDVVAVLDWELCTLGDPLADLGPADGLLGRAR